MVISDMRTIGNKLLAVRKRLGMTQVEAAEAAGLSGRTYADIERGTVNMRVETILRICQALQVTPDELLTQSDPGGAPDQEELLAQLAQCTPSQRRTALELLQVYLNSLR